MCSVLSNETDRDQTRKKIRIVVGEMKLADGAKSSRLWISSPLSGFCRP